MVFEIVQSAADWIVYTLLGLSPQSHAGSALNFFIYDTVKIFILLLVIVYVVTFIRSFFSPEKTRAWLAERKGSTFIGHILAALLGTITPFCSCSSIPLFIGFTSAGLPLGTTFSFLISSPLVDLASVILLASIFNWPIAIAYVVVGVVLAVIGGTVIDHARMERHVADFVRQAQMAEVPQQALALPDRLRFAREQVRDIVHRVWLYILVGVGIGAAIHNWIPQPFITALLGKEHWWSVPLATAVGVPMYADIFGTLPIAEALIGKGVGLGTVLAFMMAVTALSLPSLIMLKQVVRTPLLALFFVLVTSGIVVIGYLFNALAHWFV